MEEDTDDEEQFEEEDDEEEDEEDEGGEHGPESGEGSDHDDDDDEEEDEDEEESYRWWEENGENDGSAKWETLEHNGVYFPPPYEPLPSDVKMKYNGKQISLTQTLLGGSYPFFRQTCISSPRF